MIKQKLEYIYTKILIYIFKYKTNKIDYCYISQNCIGTKLYQLQNRKYTSPTIGLWLKSKDFIKFSGNIIYYINSELIHDEKLSNEFRYPVGSLEDIKIMFQHYETFSQAKKAWEERLVRLNINKIFLIMTDRDGFTDEDLLKFKEINLPKAIFTNQKRIFENSIYVPGYENQNHVGDLYTDYLKIITSPVAPKLISLLKNHSINLI